jgi:hypothetical protein
MSYSTCHTIGLHQIDAAGMHCLLALPHYAIDGTRTAPGITQKRTGSQIDQGIAIMFIPEKYFFYRSFLSRADLTSKVAAGAVLGAVLLVSIGAVHAPADGPNSVDSQEIHHLMSLGQMNGTASRLLFLETDPAWYSGPAASAFTHDISSGNRREIEAIMENGHIQTF